MCQFAGEALQFYKKAYFTRRPILQEALTRQSGQRLRAPGRMAARSAAAYRMKFNVGRSIAGVLCRPPPVTAGTVLP
ncbi:hypothetical protein SAMN05216573_103485 [Bradyrhizobium sp. Rc3b]|nr:hypothetical protein [Bradyrhizobium sp. SBR1B]SFM68787.1 hypothetical protein SAMN05216573_103485 [Bradyrhizobium sp. Rc3b]